MSLITFVKTKALINALNLPTYISLNLVLLCLKFEMEKHHVYRIVTGEPASLAHFAILQG